MSSRKVGAVDEEGGVYLTGDYEQRMAGMTRRFCVCGGYACFECGYTSHFTTDCPACAENWEIKKTEKEVKIGTIAIRNVRKVGKW